MQVTACDRQTLVLTCPEDVAPSHPSTTLSGYRDFALHYGLINRRESPPITLGIRATESSRCLSMDEEIGDSLEKSFSSLGCFAFISLRDLFTFSILFVFEFQRNDAEYLYPIIHQQALQRDEKSDLHLMVHKKSAQNQLFVMSQAITLLGQCQLIGLTVVS